MTLAELQTEFTKLKVQSCSLAVRGREGTYICCLVVEGYLDVVRGSGASVEEAIRNACAFAWTGHTR
jgi:hypothetical protein